MNEENKTAAVLAGVFLILYALPFILFSLLPSLSSGKLWEIEDWLSLGNSVLIPLAGLFLILRRPKVAAALIAITALAHLVAVFPELVDVIKSEDGSITAIENGDHPVQMPAYLGLTTLLLVLAELLLALTLFVRGPGALILALFAVASMIGSTVLQFQMFYYITGHPSPFNLLLPLNFIVAAIAAGCYLLPRGAE